MEKKIRLMKCTDTDLRRWRPMCQIVAIRFFVEESLTFKAIYSNTYRLKGFEIRRPGSTSVIGYLDARTYLLYFINKRKVYWKSIDLSSICYTSLVTSLVRYTGNGMFEMRDGSRTAFIPVPVLLKNIMDGKD